MGSHVIQASFQKEANILKKLLKSLSEVGKKLPLPARKKLKSLAPEIKKPADAKKAYNQVIKEIKSKGKKIDPDIGAKVESAIKKDSPWKTLKRYLQVYLKEGPAALLALLEIDTPGVMLKDVASVVSILILVGMVLWALSQLPINALGAFVGLEIVLLAGDVFQFILEFIGEAAGIEAALKAKAKNVEYRNKEMRKLEDLFYSDPKLVRMMVRNRPELNHPRLQKVMDQWEQDMRELSKKPSVMDQLPPPPRPEDFPMQLTPPGQRSKWVFKDPEVQKQVQEKIRKEKEEKAKETWVEKKKRWEQERKEKEETQKERDQRMDEIVQRILRRRTEPKEKPTFPNLPK